jgi:very-short-patch-repair endonuclease
MEARLVRWIVGAGLPRPVQQHRVDVGGRSYRLDVAYPSLLVGIEYDGWAAHAPRSAFDRDRARQNPLEILGWLILRYTSASTREDVIGDVRAAFEARDPSM